MSRTSNGSIPHKTHEQPVVHVLMPVYNGARFLSSQLDTILAQDYPHVRITALDDGSTDHSRDILKEYQANYPQIRLIEKSDNQGFTASISELLSEVGDDLFALSDQDDLWDPDKIRRSVAIILDQNVDLVYSDVRLCDLTGTTTQPAYLAANDIRPHVGKRPLPFIFRNPILGHTIVGTGRLAHAARPLPRAITFHEAWLASIACTLNGVGYEPAQLGSYRVHDSNVIGPKTPPSLRLWKQPDQRRWVLRREETRRAGLQATSHLWSQHRQLAHLYTFRGWSRLLRLPLFFRTLAMEYDILGWRQVVVESIYFVFAAFISSDDRKS